MIRPCGPVPRDRREVDAELGRDLADERRRAHLLAAAARRRGLRRSLLGASAPASGRDSVAADHDEHRSDRDDLAFRDEDPRDLPARRRRDLDGRLVGGDLDERRVLGDVLALLDEPARDLAFGQALAEVGQLELVGHGR